MKVAEQIGSGPTVVIAEVGADHGGSLERAKLLAIRAAEAGADVVKFQFWSSAKRMAQRRHAPWLEELYGRVAMPEAWLDELAAFGEDNHIELACSVYLPEDAYTVASRFNILKVASFEAHDRELLVALRGYPTHDLIVSLGFNASCRVPGYWVNAGPDGSTRRRLYFLHCISAYPAQPAQFNLKRIREEELHGFSDHAPSHHRHTGAVAVGAGARILERHIMLLDSRSENNPDHGHSMNADDFADYVRNVRIADDMMRWRPGAQECEASAARYRVAL